MRDVKNISNQIFGAIYFPVIKLKYILPFYIELSWFNTPFMTGILYLILPIATNTKMRKMWAGKLVVLQIVLLKKTYYRL